MGGSVFSGLSVITLFMTQQHHFFWSFGFFFPFNGDKFSLWLTKLLKYLSHILLNANEIGYYFLPCLLILLVVPHTTVLMVFRLIYSLQFILHRSYFLRKSKKWKMKLCVQIICSQQMTDCSEGFQEMDGKIETIISSFLEWLKLQLEHKKLGLAYELV